MRSSESLRANASNDTAHLRFTDVVESEYHIRSTETDNGYHLYQVKIGRCPTSDGHFSSVGSIQENKRSFIPETVFEITSNTPSKKNFRLMCSRA